MISLEEQFGAVYDQYIEKIYRFVYLKVSSQENAEDITSKVFIKGWEAFSRQNGDIKNPGAFLFQIARNSVIDHYRQKGRQNTVSTEVMANIAMPGNLHEKAVANADFEEIRKAILELKKDYQDVIICRYVEDMDVSEIALALGKNEGAVRVILHRGLKELKRICNKNQVLAS